MKRSRYPGRLKAASKTLKNKITVAHPECAVKGNGENNGKIIG